LYVKIVKQLLVINEKEIHIIYNAFDMTLEYNNKVKSETS